MNHRVGIWIDHKTAVIMSASADGVTTRFVESEVGAHPRYAGQQDGGGEKSTRNVTVRILTGTTMTSSVSLGNLRPFSFSGRARPSWS